MIGLESLRKLPLLLTGLLVPGATTLLARPPLPAQPEAPELPVEIIDPSPHLPGLPGWLVLLAILLICIPLIAIVFFILQKNDNFTFRQSGPSPFDEAREKLLTLRDLPPATPLADISTRISLILRQYLARSKSDSALFQTREEFLTDAQRLQHIPEPAKTGTSDYLSELASLQYAPPSSDPEQIEALITKSLAILDRLAEPEPQPAPAATDD